MNLWKAQASLALLATLGLAACEGAAGPTGPAGDPGPGTRISFTGTLDADGIAGHVLPPAAGDVNNLPGATCWVSEDGIVWDSFFGCILAVDLDGSLVVFVALGEEAAGWRYEIVVVY